MENKEVSNSLIISIILLLIVAIIVTKTVMVVNQRHDDKSLYSMKSNIEYYAKRCYLENKCEGTITLNDLYTKGYIRKQVVNPVTKEVLNPNITINYVNDSIVVNY